MNYLWIAIGSALGGMSRYGCSRAIAVSFGETFPWGTLAVNILGSFVIGFFAAISGPEGRLIVSPDIRQFVMIGFCGGFTTFSSFSLQTFDLIRNGDLYEASANIALSVIACIAAVVFGFIAAAAVNGSTGFGR